VRAPSEEQSAEGMGCGEGFPLPTGEGAGAIPAPQKMFRICIFKWRLLVHKYSEFLLTVKQLCYREKNFFICYQS